jgi:hypothetical protein
MPAVVEKFSSFVQGGIFWSEIIFHFSLVDRLKVPVVGENGASLQRTSQ